MAVKLGLLLICFIIGVNSFITRKSSEELSLFRDDARHDQMKAKRHDHAPDMREQFGQSRMDLEHREGSEEERREMILGDDARHGRRTQHYSSGQQREAGRQKIKIRYSTSSSSSSSSEERSNESHEIRQAQRQYHDTILSNKGIRWAPKPDTHRYENAELPEYHNTIEKD